MNEKSFHLQFIFIVIRDTLCVQFFSSACEGRGIEHDLGVIPQDSGN